MARLRSADSREAIEVDRLEEWLRHEDNLLATRVSVFLLAQSILIAVTVSLVNTVAGFKPSSSRPLRTEVFGLAIVINLSGIVLTLVFWYVFTLNFENVGSLFNELHRVMDKIDQDNVRSRVDRERVKRRNSHWYFRVIFRRKGMNWIIVNILPIVFLFLWCTVGSFSLAIFFSR